MEKLQILKDIFGHSAFRPGQERVVEELLSGRDALCVMPTGAGKSVCYQVPALLLPGVTLVVSPLISLMKDQVTTLVQMGVRAAYLNSSLTLAQYDKALENMAAGKYKLVYVAPERLTSPSFLSACRRMTICMLAVDEAHCISQWGQDFRPSYLQIPAFLAQLETRPVIGAFTATATEKVKADIRNALGLHDPYCITTGFDRANLGFTVLKPKSKSAALLELLSDRPEDTGIVYCATRKTVERVCEELIRAGYAATRYHAGLSDAERKKNQEDFLFDRRRIMVATNAFGMGIDKSNVRFVIHYNMPKDVESYYQEAGRAGRDGAAADCVLLYSPADVRTNRFLIEHGEARAELESAEQQRLQEKELQRLAQITAYCTTKDCLRGYILAYFGETAPENCGNCSNCTGEFEEWDITAEAEIILAAIRLAGERYGQKLIRDMLRGSRAGRVLELGLDEQTNYGRLRHIPGARLQTMMEELEREGYLIATGGDYPVLKTTEKTDAVLFDGETVTIRVAKAQKTRKKAPSGGQDADLLSELKALRRRIAEEKGVPAFMVFPDTTLIDMCLKRPRTKAEFLQVSGVGNYKLRLYGEAFLKAIETYG